MRNGFQPALLLGLLVVREARAEAAIDLGDPFLAGEHRRLHDPASLAGDRKGLTLTASKCVVSLPVFVSSGRCCV